MPRTKSHFQYKKFVQPGIGIGTAAADSIGYWAPARYRSDPTVYQTWRIKSGLRVSPTYSKQRIHLPSKLETNPTTTSDERKTNSSSLDVLHTWAQRWEATVTMWHRCAPTKANTANLHHVLHVTSNWCHTVKTYDYWLHRETTIHVALAVPKTRSGSKIYK